MEKDRNIFKSIFTKLPRLVFEPILRPRKYRLKRPVNMKRHWMNGDPVATAFFNSLSISFPHAEIFMIGSVKAWREHVSERQRQDVDAFIEQELNHSREHVAFNRGMDKSGFESGTVEKDIIKLVSDLNLRDDLFKLQMTVCMEHLTAVLSSEFLSQTVHLEGAEPELKKMWLWHATEEIEHKAVAFNIWSEVTKDRSNFSRWLSRSAMFAVISYRFFKNRTVAQIHFLKQDGYSGPQAFMALMRYGFQKNGMLRNILKPWAAFFKVNFHPWSIDDRHLIATGESQFIMDDNGDQSSIPTPVIDDSIKPEKPSIAA